MLVPRELLSRAIAWNSLAGQFASIFGPALAGALIAVSPAAAFGVPFVLYAAALVSITRLRGVTRPISQGGSRLAMMREGLAYVWTNKVVFGAISLDLAAVILAGAMALLPAFARDVLKVGPEGFGCFRSAIAVGSASMALLLSVRPIRTQAGLKMFIGVAIFCVGNVVFGLSRTFWLSLVTLAVLGAADQMSVFVRQTLVQLKSPDEMRGARRGGLHAVHLAPPTSSVSSAAAWRRGSSGRSRRWSTAASPASSSPGSGRSCFPPCAPPTASNRAVAEILISFREIDPWAFWTARSCWSPAAATASGAIAR